MLVHEFAHYIDVKSEPKITLIEYIFLCEVFSFYMEIQLEKYLQKEDELYNELIALRKNNRIFFENKFMKSIKTQLYYEELYIKQGYIEEEQINIADAEKMLKYNVSNIVNYLLRYPLGNILSEYIINNNLLENDSDICKICLQLDLEPVIEDYFITKTKKKILN